MEYNEERFGILGVPSAPGAPLPLGAISTGLTSFHNEHKHLPFLTALLGALILFVTSCNSSLYMTVSPQALTSSHLDTLCLNVL